jgi:hypothetical protein
LIYGDNRNSQLALKSEIQDILKFFPEFYPLDSLLDYDCYDLAIG